MISRPRFMISAAHKSSGKTVISIGLAAALDRAGTRVATFKKGPDYIDPMWLSLASRTACYNLDFNAMSRAEIMGLMQHRSANSDLSLVEANKGLFDGVAQDGSDSNAALARMLQLPVVLVIDTTGMTRGIAPLLLGYETFDSDVRIAGVILNKVGGTRHEGKLRAAVENYTDLPVLGAVARNPALEIGERHLGLTTPGETDGQDHLIDRIAGIVAESVDLDALRRLAQAAPALDPVAFAPVESRVGEGLKIAIARDAAFGFYYPDDLEAFAQAGAQLLPVDMMTDQSLGDIDALFIGGGFPEIHAAELAANTTLRAEVKAALHAGLPCYAECGGLMYLCESLHWDGKTYPMVGTVPGNAVMHKLPQGRGYVEFLATGAHPWGRGNGQATKAHEFHYASIDGLQGSTAMALEMARGRGIDGRGDGIVVHNTLAGFSHLRSCAADPWVPQFLSFVRACKENRSRT
jgi:cobyrinic acid a,c-diamide synthase